MKYEVGKVWQRIVEAKLMRADEVLGGIWSIWSFIKYDLVKWYWMRRDHHTGWMVRCSLQPVYVKSTWRGSRKGKYAWTFDCVFFSTDGLCRDVDAGVLVMYTTVCLQVRNFHLFLLVFHSWGVCVWNGVVWRMHFIVCFFLFFCYCCYCVFHTVLLQSFYLDIFL